MVVPRIATTTVMYSAVKLICGTTRLLATSPQGIFTTNTTPT